MVLNKRTRLCALFLALALLFSVLACLTSCQVPDDETPDDPPEEDKQGSSYLENIIKPEYKDYGRGTINFSDMVYARPNISSMISLSKDITALVTENTASYDEQLAKIKELDDLAANLLTMRGLAAIYVARDSSNDFWNEENNYILTNYSSFTLESEKLLVACANSTHAKAFEDDFFGKGFIDEYKDGPKLTEDIIKLQEDEAELIAAYEALSTDSIIINYNGKEDTAENILSYYKSKYGERSSEYFSISTVVMQLYENSYKTEAKDILIELIKVRRLIAEENGNDNYLDYIYEQRKLDYTPNQISSFITEISSYVLPVYIQLYSYVFYYYFIENEAPEVTFDTLINNSYETIKDMDSEFGEIFSYMLQHGLFNIEGESDNRQEGAFTLYLNNYEAPFIFMTGNENITDYTTLIHEFGHFVDMYINSGNNSSVDVSEIFSQALELLSLGSMSDVIGEEYKTYLTYSALNNALEALVYQGFYARIEEGMYKLEFNQITESAINEIIVDATQEFMINSSAVYKIEHVLIPHFFSSPCYVHSYCTSVVPALEIFLKENESIGSGFEAYKEMLNRDGEEIEFLTLLEMAELTSPFEKGYLKDIADKIHYFIIGSHYYQSSPPMQPAA